MIQNISEFFQDQEDQNKATLKAYSRQFNLKLSEAHKSFEELVAEERLKIKLERVEMEAKQRTSEAYAEADARGVREAEANFLATGLAANHPPAAEPVPTATPLIEQPTIWTDKRKREARAMLNKLKGEGKRAFHKMTADHYQVSTQRLRDVLNDSGAPAPKKARGQNSVFDVKPSKVHRIK